MQYIQFKEQFSNHLAFSVLDIKKAYPDFNMMNLVNWQQKNYIKKLRNGWYRFNNKIENENELFYIANKIYSPSYISLETALKYYGLIPEEVFSIYSISTSKTITFNNEVAVFKYSKLKNECFFGYKLITSSSFTYKIADIEKSLLDFIHLRIKKTSIEDYAAYRINQSIVAEQVDFQKLLNYAKLFKNKHLMQKISEFKKYTNA